MHGVCSYAKGAHTQKLLSNYCTSCELSRSEASQPSHLSEEQRCVWTTLDYFGLLWKTQVYSRFIAIL